MPKDDLAQARQWRDDIRALKQQYPELTAPGAQRRLAESAEDELEKEHRMPRPGDRMLGEDLSIVTFRIPTSALPLIDEHLLRMQAASRWVRLGKSDAQRDIFLRGLEQIELLPAPGRSAVPEPEPELPLERVVTDTVTDTNDATAAAIAAIERAIGRPLSPAGESAAQRLATMHEAIAAAIVELDDTPLEMEPVTDTVTDTPAAAAATAETVKTARRKTTAKRKTARTAKGRR